jgi:hypothetical protein
MGGKKIGRKDDKEEKMNGMERREEGRCWLVVHGRW